MDIAIRDEVTGDEPGAQSVIVHRINRARLAAFQTLTVADFIRHRVELEHDRLTEAAANPSPVEGSADAPTAEWLWEQYRPKPATPAPPSRRDAIDAALAGFARQSYLLFVNDRQVVSLDEPLDIETLRDVLFLKLTPLQGG